MTSKTAFRLTVSCLVCLALVAPASAEDVAKKFRLSFMAGGLNAQDEVKSQAGNILIVRAREDQELLRIYLDPRSDSAVFGNLDINPGTIATFSAQYAVSKIFMVEASLGYQKTDVGDVEVQVQFENVEILDQERFNFDIIRVPVGKLTRVPLALTAIARFRPRAAFNPYLGAGIGYSFIGYEASDEFDQLSRNMDASVGQQSVLTEATFGRARLIDNIFPDEDLSGADVDARDTFEWNLVGGAEYTFRKNWALVLDVRYSISSRSLGVRFNNSSSLGKAVPNFTVFENSRYDPGGESGDSATVVYGPIRINRGGLFDVGRSIVVVADGAPAGTDCPTDPDVVLDPAECTLRFVPIPDGELDPGFYYVQGGKVKYDAFSFQFGVRYTF